MAKNKYKTVEELREEERRNRLMNMKIDDGKDVHTIAEIKQAAIDQGIIQPPEPVQPTVQQPKPQTTQRQSLSDKVAQDKKKRAQDLAKKGKTVLSDKDGNLFVKDPSSKYGNIAVPADTIGDAIAEKLGGAAKRDNEIAKDTYAAKSLASKKMSKYDKDTRYADVKGDIADLTLAKDSAKKSGEDTSYIDMAIAKLKDYLDGRYPLTGKSTYTPDEEKEAEEENTATDKPSYENMSAAQRAIAIAEQQQAADRYATLNSKENQLNADAKAQKVYSPFEKEKEAAKLAKQAEENLTVYEPAYDYDASQEATEDRQARYRDNQIKIRQARERGDNATADRLEAENKAYEQEHKDDFVSEYEKIGKSPENRQYRDAGDYTPKTKEEINNSVDFSAGEYFLSGDRSFLNDIPDKLGAFLNAEKDESDGLQKGFIKFTQKYGKAIGGVYSSLNLVSSPYEGLLQEGYNNGWSAISDDEKDTYYVLYNTQGKEAAYDYLDKIKDRLQKRANYEIPKSATESSEGLDLAARNVSSVFDNAIGGASGTADNIQKYLTGQELEPYSPAHSLALQGNATREVTAQKADDLFGADSSNTWAVKPSDVYNAGMSAADMALAYIIGPAAYSASMGASAAESTARDLYDAGENSDVIMAESIASGVFEALFEEWSLDKIVKISDLSGAKTAKEIVKKWFVNEAKSAGVEASEEVATEAANMLVDLSLRGERSDVKSVGDFVSRLYEAGKGGALGGLFGSTMHTTADAAGAAGKVYQTNKYYKQTGADITGAGNTKELIDRARAMNNDNVTKEADKLEALTKKDGGKNLDNKIKKQTGKLYTAMQEVNANNALYGASNEITSAVKTAYQSAYEEETGETLSEKDLNKAAEAIVKDKFTDEKLTKEEQEIVSTSAAQAASANIDQNLDVVTERAALAKRRGMSDYEATAKLTAAKEQETAKSDDDVDIAEFNVHEDDNKVYTADGSEQVNLKADAPIASVGSRGVELNLENGNTESAQNLDIPTQDAVFFKSVSDLQNELGEIEITPEMANTLYKTYQSMEGEKPSISQYMLDAKKVIFNGYTNNTAIDNSINLPQSLRNSLYHYGASVAASHTEAQQQAVKNAIKQSTKANQKREGKVIFVDGINKNRLDPRRYAGYKVMEAEAKATGRDVVFYRSTKGSDGKWRSDYITENNLSDNDQAPEGFWKDGKLYIDINSGLTGKGLILFTAAHEMTHMIEDGAPEQWKAYADFIVENYVKHGTDVNDLVRKMMVSYPKLTPAQAFREVIARASEGMLRDTHPNEKSAALYKQNRTLWETIKDIFNKLISLLKKGGYEIAQVETEEARLVSKWDIATIEKAQDLWLQGKVAAAENLRKMDSVPGEGETRFKGRDSRYDFSLERDLDTLDDQEIKVYNDRGWSYSLFNEEDMKLLYEKFDEINQNKFTNDFVLDDGSVLAEINNKMVLLYGTRDVPKVFSVFAINVDNEIDAEQIKELVYSEIGNYKRDRTSSGELLRYVQQRAGNGIVRYFEADDYRFAKGKEAARNRAVLPDGFKNYGYTQYAYGRKGNRSEAAQAITIDYSQYEDLDYSDRLYLQDVEKGDIESAQRAIDGTANKKFQFSKARANNGKGKLLKMYHWTDSDFESFDTSLSGNNQGQTHGDGIYISTSPNEFSYAGKKRLELYADIRKPFNMQLTKKQAQKVLDKYASKKHDLDAYNGMYREHALEKLLSPVRVFDYLKEYAKDNDIKVSDILTDLGYDGVHDGSEWVAFDSEQLKSADPVTYDDNGDVIPLSERFNTEKKDIRYKDRANKSGDLSFDDFEIDLEEDDTISDIFAKDYAKHSEDIGEVLKNISDIELDTKKVTSIVNKVIRENIGDIDSHTRDILSLEVQLALENVDRTDPEEVSNAMISAVRKAIEEATVPNEGVEENYQDFLSAFKGKTFFLTDEQIADLKEHDKTLNDFKKAMMGKFTVTKRENAARSVGGGFKNAQELSLEGLYESLEHPEEYLPYSREEWDQENYHAPMIIMETFDKLKKNNTIKVSEMSTAEDLDDQAVMLAAKITGDIVEAKYKSKYKGKDSQYNKNAVKQQHAQTDDYIKLLVDNLTIQHENELAEQKKRSAEKLAALKQRERERAAKREKDITEHYKEQRKKGVERRNTTKMRNAIKSKVEKIDKLLNRSAKEKTVKQGLRESASKLLDVADMLYPESRSLEQMAREGVADATPEEQKLLDKYVEYLDIREKTTTEKGRKHANDVLALIRKQLSKEGITVEVEEDGKTVKKKMSVTARERMRYENAKRAYNDLHIKDVLQEFGDAYRQVEDSKETNLAESYDSRIIDMIESLKKDVGDTLAKDLSYSQLEKLNDIVTWTTKSIQNANKLFAENLKETYTEISKAVIKEVTTVRLPKEVRSGIIEKTLDFAWWSNLKPIYAMRFIGSETLEKLYWNLQHGESIFYVDISEAKEYKEGLQKKYNYKDFDFKKKATFTARDGSKFTLDLNQMMDIYAASRRKQALQHLLHGGFTFESGSKAGKLKVNTGAKAYSLTIDTINAIADQLTDDQIFYVEEMQNYLSTVMADKGNEISMKMYGINLFKESTYWNISSSDVYVKTEETDYKPKFAFENAGFTKDTIRNATNPIVLRGFEENWSNHVNEMSLYHSLVLPLRDFTKVFNYKSSGENSTNYSGVKSTIDGAYSVSATKYINQFLDDINGGIQSASRLPLNSFIAMYKKGAVYGNLSVVFQQYGAVFRAMAYVDMKHFLATMPKAASPTAWWSKKSFEELKKYAPIAGIKEMGSFDTGTGRGVIDWLSSDERKSKPQRVFDKAEDILGFLPEKMDKVAWVRLWEAIKRETEYKYGYKRGTEENLTKSGERFNEVVHLTQVYDSVFSRSAAMRSKDTGVKMVTSFMAEPTTIMNMKLDAYIQGKRTGFKNGGVRKIARVNAALIVSGLATILAHSLIKGARDDDEDETYPKKYWQALQDDLVDNMIPTNYFPWLRDLYSIVMGYTVKREDISPIGDVVAAIKNLAEDGGSADNWIDTTAAVSVFTPFPLKGVVKDARAAMNLYTTFTGNWHKLNASELNRLTPKKYDEAYEKAEKDGLSEDECKQAGEQAVLNYYTRELKPVYLDAVKRGDTKKQMAVRSYMYKSGYYKSLPKIDELLNEWKEDIDSEDAWKYADYYYQKAYTSAWNDGYTKEECEQKGKQAARNKIASSLKEPYVEAVKGNDTAKMNEIRTFMINSGYYQSRKKNGTTQQAVDDTLKNWREVKDDADNRSKVAEERAKNY